MTGKMLTFCSVRAKNDVLSIRPEDIVALYGVPSGQCAIIVRGDSDVQGLGHYYDDVKQVLQEHGVEFIDCTGLPAFVGSNDAMDVVSSSLTENVLSETPPAPPAEDSKQD